MGRRLSILIAIASLALARAAFAGEPAPAPVATAPSDATASQIDAWLTDDDGAPAGGAGPVAPATPVARAIHGEASVGFGSNGYREVSLAAAIPIGETSTLGVAVGDESFRGRDRRSLDVSLAVGSGISTEPCGLRHTGTQLADDAARSTRCGPDLGVAAP